MVCKVPAHLLFVPVYSHHFGLQIIEIQTSTGFYSSAHGQPLARFLVISALDAIDICPLGDVDSSVPNKSRPVLTHLLMYFCRNETGMTPALQSSLDHLLLFPSGKLSFNINSIEEIEAEMN